jgi:hypothetical protein
VVLLALLLVSCVRSSAHEDGGLEQIRGPFSAETYDGGISWTRGDGLQIRAEPFPWIVKNAAPDSCNYVELNLFSNRDVSAAASLEGPFEFPLRYPSNKSVTYLIGTDVPAPMPILFMATAVLGTGTFQGTLRIGDAYAIEMPLWGEVSEGGNCHDAPCNSPPPCMQSLGYCACGSAFGMLHTACFYAECANGCDSGTCIP